MFHAKQLTFCGNVFLNWLDVSHTLRKNMLLNILMSFEQCEQSGKCFLHVASPFQTTSLLFLCSMKHDNKIGELWRYRSAFQTVPMDRIPLTAPPRSSLFLVGFVLPLPLRQFSIVCSSTPDELRLSSLEILQ